MVLVAENSALIQEKQKLIIKLDNSKNYKTDEEREIDEKRLGEVQREMKTNLQKYLVKSKATIAKKVQKITTPKEAKKLLKEKYEDYRQVTIKAREFVDSCVDKKKEGRDLMERMVAAKGKTDRKLISDILKF